MSLYCAAPHGVLFRRAPPATTTAIPAFNRNENTHYTYNYNYGIVG